MSEFVLLKNLAEEFGLDRSSIRRYVLKNNFEPLKVRTIGSRGQLILALTTEDAESVREMRRMQGYTTKSRIGKPVMDNGEGVFYIIQLVPELEPERVKLGFSRDMESRLSAHRTAAPTAKLLETWPCHRNWELAVIASITRTECNPLSDEVFVVQDIEALIERGAGFFALMPKLEVGD